MKTKSVIIRQEQPKDADGNIITCGVAGGESQEIENDSAVIYEF